MGTDPRVDWGWVIKLIAGNWIGGGSPRMQEGKCWAKRKTDRKELHEVVVNLIAHSCDMEFYIIVTIITFQIILVIGC